MNTKVVIVKQPKNYLVNGKAVYQDLKGQWISQKPLSTNEYNEFIAHLLSL